MRDVICPLLKELLDITEGLDVGPKGFRGSRNKGYLFSSSWEVLVIIFRNYFQVSGEQPHSSRDLGNPAESEKISP